MTLNKQQASVTFSLAAFLVAALYHVSTPEKSVLGVYTVFSRLTILDRTTYCSPRRVVIITQTSSRSDECHSLLLKRVKRQLSQPDIGQSNANAPNLPSNQEYLRRPIHNSYIIFQELISKLKVCLSSVHPKLAHVSD